MRRAAGKQRGGNSVTVLILTHKRTAAKAALGSWPKGHPMRGILNYVVSVWYSLGLAACTIPGVPRTTTGRR